MRVSQSLIYTANITATSKPPLKTEKSSPCVQISVIRLFYSQLVVIETKTDGFELKTCLNL